MPLPNPVLVLPGITANYLEDRYPLPYETIWKVMDGDRQYDRASLHPDNLQYEAIQPSLVRPGQLYEMVYSELIEELRYNLRDREDEPVPVFPFSYDWRQPIEQAAEALAGAIDEAIARTMLLRHYDRAGYGTNAKVNLVGHSMGGLVIAAYLKRYGDLGKVGKVATLAAPFRGSFEPVIKLITGTADLGAGAPSSREREAARMTPSLYQLLADLPGTVTFLGNSAPADLFDPANWQPSVVETIEQYVRTRGLVRSNRPEQARALFERFLERGRGFRTLMNGFSLEGAGLTDGDWLCIAGVNAETRVRLSIDTARRDPSFVFRSADRVNYWGDPHSETAFLTGDGTVPLKSAVPDFLPRERVVCLKPSDFGYWEIGDSLVTRMAGLHGMLPTMDVAHRMIVRFFRNAADPHQNTWGMPVPGIAAEAWKPPLRGGLRIR